MAKKRVTIHDIARELGLTGSTVSRALNDHPRISAATKKLVKEKAQELHYRPNQVASTLRTGRSKTIGLVVPRINRTFFANVIHGVEQVCTAYGYNLLICQSQEQLQKEKAALETLRKSRVDGILLSLSSESSQTEHVQSILKSGIPLILFDRVNGSVPTSMVVNQDRDICYQLTRHLIGQGCRRFVHFGGPQFLDSYKNRYLGFQMALREEGLPCLGPGEPILTREKGQEQVKHLFSGLHPPDAIVAASDYSAQGSLETLLDMGIRVPDEVAVAGYANEPFTAMLKPGLTSVELFPSDIGKQSATLLLDQLQENRVDTTLVTKWVKPLIHYRASTQRI